MVIGKEKSKYFRKRVFQQTHCLSQIPHGLPWNRFGASAVIPAAPAGTVVPTVTQWSAASCTFVTTGLPTLCRASIIAETSTTQHMRFCCSYTPLDGRKRQCLFVTYHVLNTGPFGAIVKVCPRTHK